MNDNHQDNVQVDEFGSTLHFVATKTERLVYTWPVREFSDRVTPTTTQVFHFMGETSASNVQWKLHLLPRDVDGQGNPVVSAQVNIINNSGTENTRGFKVNISMCLLDVNQQEVHQVSSSVYYLYASRDHNPGGATSYKAKLISREELLSHHLLLLPNNTLTLVVKMVFVQERTSPDVKHDDFLVPTTSLSSDLGEAFASADFTDMTIVCDKREFHCHKFMLASRSEVFAAMLRHEFLEKQNSRVDVKELAGETMALLLSYIYTGQVQDFSNVSVVDLFKAADRYRLDHLKHICEEELVTRVEASNAADILSLAHKYNALPLKSFALAMIARNVEEVMRSPGWKELILSDQGLLVEAFDSLARYNTELKNKIESGP